MTPRAQRTLIYCLKLYAFIVPVYFLAYRGLWKAVPWRTALINSLIFGVVNVIFLGAVRYYMVGRGED